MLNKNTPKTHAEKEDHEWPMHGGICSHVYQLLSGDLFGGDEEKESF